jgi:hypothetical protein
METSMIDFNALLNSHLFKLGTIAYFKPEERLFHSTVASFDIVSSPERMLDEGPKPFKGSDISVNPHLYRIIDYTNIAGVNEVLIAQWREVQNIVSQLPLKPHAGLLIMEPAGVPVRYHTHSHITKQILSFSYCWPETAVDNTERSHLIVGSEFKKAYFPDSVKAVSRFFDNDRHGAMSNEWRFYWAYDFDGYFDVPDELIQDFTKFNWDRE